MGSEKSKAIEQSKFVSPHPHFHNASVISDHDVRYIQTKIATQDKVYDQWKKQVKGGVSPLSGNYLLLPDHIDYKQADGLCGNNCTVTNSYPYFPYLLSEEIEVRRQTQNLFKQSDLWYLLFSLSAAKNDIKQNSQRVGDIKPANVFINHDGKVKVANIYSWPGEQINYAKVIDRQNPVLDSLLAPEDLDLLSKESTHNNSNTLSEEFSIGATVLSAGTLNHLSSVYNYKSNGFSYAELKAITSEWLANGKYSEIFKSIVLNLVDVNPEKRLSNDELWSWISKYHQPIESREKFIINKAPEKIEHHVSVLRSSYIPKQ